MTAPDVPPPLPPLGLYLHLPWCVRKCPYCDFNSYQTPDGGLPERAYVTALLADAERDAPYAGGRPVETVFLGGGTPSLFTPESLAALLSGLRERLAFAPDAEITLEANPGTIERGRFDGYRDAGINRVSLGAQSFAGAQLAALGRIHQAGDTRRAVADLQAAQLTNYNLDLMHGLPEQTPEQAAHDVATALALGASHVSYYHLTLEPGTAFHRQPPGGLPDEDVGEAIERAGLDALAAAGFERYEISAWARPGRACRHNLNYWRFGDYLGLGAGAHGKVTLAGSGEILRTTKSRNPVTYLRLAAAGQALGESSPVAPSARAFEFMLNAMRLAEGFEPALFERRTGLPFAAVEPRLAELAGRGLVETRAQSVRATALGWRFLNDVQVAFLDS